MSLDEWLGRVFARHRHEHESAHGPYTLGYLAGRRDFSTTRRYVHPQAQTVTDAIERAPIATTVSGPRPRATTRHKWSGMGTKLGTIATAVGDRILQVSI
jgi:hypothetical protein